MMPYKLIPAVVDDSLFFRLDKDTARRYGAIGYMKADFGKSGREFWSSWFDEQPQLNTYSFKGEFNDVINSLRDDEKQPIFASRNNLSAFCSANPGKKLGERGDGYIVQTLDYTYCFRCLPRPGDYDVYCFAYCNRYLLNGGAI
jgi:hypothetical protein